MNFRFWHRWLVVASVAFAVFCVMVALFPFAPLFAMRKRRHRRDLLRRALDGRGARVPCLLVRALGGTIAGFYMLQAFIAAIPLNLNRAKRWAWHAIVWGTVAWFVVDSAVSRRLGAAFNGEHRPHRRLRHPAGGDVPDVLRSGRQPAVPESDRAEP